MAELNFNLVLAVLWTIPETQCMRSPSTPCCLQFNRDKHHSGHVGGGGYKVILLLIYSFKGGHLKTFKSLTFHVENPKNHAHSKQVAFLKVICSQHLTHWIGIPQNECGGMLSKCHASPEKDVRYQVTRLSRLQLAVTHHRSELCGFTYTGIIFDKCGTVL